MDILSAAREEAKNKKSGTSIDSISDVIKSSNEKINDVREQIKDLMDRLEKLPESSDEPVVKKNEPDVYQIDETDSVVGDINQVKQMIDNILAASLAQPDKVSPDKIKLCNDAIALFNHYMKTMVNKASITKFKYPVCGACS